MLAVILASDLFLHAHRHARIDTHNFPPNSNWMSLVPCMQRYNYKVNKLCQELISAQLQLSKSTNRGVNQCSKYVTRVQQQRPESPTVTLTWHACKYMVQKLHQRYIPQKGCTLLNKRPTRMCLGQQQKSSLVHTCRQSENTSCPTQPTARRTARFTQQRLSACLTAVNMKRTMKLGRGQS